MNESRVHLVPSLVPSCTTAGNLGLKNDSTQYACTSVPRDAGKVNYLALLSDFLLRLVWLLAMKFPQKIKRNKARRR